MSLKKRHYLFFILVLLIISQLYGEVQYKVSGKVIRNGKGYSGITIEIHIISKIKEGDFYKNYSRYCVTNKNGDFNTYLRPGKYHFFCRDVILEKNPERLIAIGPEEILVESKNIKNINYILFSESEIILNNLDILAEVSPNINHITYQYGRVPLQAETICKSLAELSLKSFKNSDNPIIINATLSKPVTFYDFYDNPVFYQYPITYKNIEIGYIGVHSVGLSPHIDNFKGILNISFEKFEKNIDQLKLKKRTWDSRISLVIGKIAELKNTSIDNFEFIKLLCLSPKEIGSLYILIKNKLNNELLVVSLVDNSILNDYFDLTQIKKYNEIQNCLFYIMEVKQHKGLPLIQ